MASAFELHTGRLWNALHETGISSRRAAHRCFLK
jgi:hypothetical protein